MAASNPEFSVEVVVESFRRSTAMAPLQKIAMSNRTLLRIRNVDLIFSSSVLTRSSFSERHEKLPRARNAPCGQPGSGYHFSVTTVWSQPPCLSLRNQSRQLNAGGEQEAKQEDADRKRHSSST
jgi:hypothetical protein